MKKHTWITLAIIVAIAVLPTGDPSDIFISIPLMQKMGKAYLILAVIAIYVLYHYGVFGRKKK